MGIKKVVLLEVAIVFMLYCGIAACNDSTNQLSIKNNKESLHAEINNRAIDKISPSLYKVVQALTEQGADKAENHSSTLIHVNEAGAIQVYIYATVINEGLLEQLEENKVNIEITNADYNIIQGWVPYNEIGNVAKIAEVERITPPSYGATMENK
jgi:hypothetical protein